MARKPDRLCAAVVAKQESFGNFVGMLKIFDTVIQTPNGRVQWCRDKTIGR